MGFEHVYEQLIKSPQFKQWPQREQSYLTHFFSKLDSSLTTNLWDVGFYNPDTKKITVFEVAHEVVKKPEDDVFREQGHPKKLELDKVKTQWEQVREAVLRVQNDHYPAQMPASGFTILQHLEQGQVWNTTLVTVTFSALNIKVDAATGDVASHAVTSFFDLRK